MSCQDFCTLALCPQPSKNAQSTPELFIRCIERLIQLRPELSILLLPVYLIFYTMKFSKAITWFLGVSMFMFGVLKFFDPFKSWYAVQITQSGLGELAYILGIAGELGVGLALLLIMMYGGRISPARHRGVILMTCVTVVVMMATAVYVHLHPAVPVDVLPMKIKPPVIPLFFMMLALINIGLVWRLTER